MHTCVYVRVKVLGGGRKLAAALHEDPVVRTSALPSFAFSAAVTNSIARPVGPMPTCLADQAVRSHTCTCLFFFAIVHAPFFLRACTHAQQSRACMASQAILVAPLMPLPVPAAAASARWQGRRVSGATADRLWDHKRVAALPQPS